MTSGHWQHYSVNLSIYQTKLKQIKHINNNKGKYVSI